MKHWGEIRTAYDAYWFLHEHPSFVCSEYTRITEAEAGEASKSYDVIQDERGQWWRKWHMLRHSIDSGLDIHYALVDESGSVNDDHSKNVHAECWLEFGGPMKNSGADCGDWDNTGPMYFLNTHDIDLDSGGPTFDAALIMMANKALELYGNCERPEWVGDSGSENRRLERAIVGALKSAIDAHGPITNEFIASAAKRIVGNVVSLGPHELRRINSERSEK